jgi:hypothetical protein
MKHELFLWAAIRRRSSATARIGARNKNMAAGMIARTTSSNCPGEQPHELLYSVCDSDEDKHTGEDEHTGEVEAPMTVTVNSRAYDSSPHKFFLV